MRDPYTVLGVSKNASQDEIKKAFRRMARTMHPDLHPNDAKAAERFKEINAAYSLLSDADKRAKYDRGEIDADGNPRHPGFGSGAGAGSYRWRSNAALADKPAAPSVSTSTRHLAMTICSQISSRAPAVVEAALALEHANRHARDQIATIA